MAGMKSIDAAGTRLEEALLNADLLRQAMQEVAGDSHRPVMAVFANAVWDVHQAAYAYMEQVHEVARPVLNDHEKVLRPN